MLTKNKYTVYHYAILLFLIVMLVAWLAYRFILYPSPEYPIAREIRYSFTLQNPSNQLLENVDFWVYGPVKQTSIQYTRAIEATHPYELTTDELGNQLLHFKFDKFPPFATRVLSIKAQLQLTDKPNRVKQPSPDTFLQAEKYVEMDNQGIRALAASFAHDDAVLTAETANQWVYKNIKYAGYIKDDRGAAYAFRSRSGDCTEYMYLYTAINRLNKIPTRGMGGYVYAENSVLKPEDFHNWAEVYLDNAWQAVDPQNGIFRKNQSHYIALRVISQKYNESLNLTNTHRFASSNSDILIRMN